MGGVRNVKCKIRRLGLVSAYFFMLHVKIKTFSGVNVELLVEVEDEDEDTLALFHIHIFICS